MKKRLLWQISGYYASILVISLSVLAWQAAKTTRNSYMEHAKSALEASARLSALLLRPFLVPLDERALQTACREAGEKARARITVILPRGRVAADSVLDPSTLENHSDRSEISRAFAGEVGIAERPSPSLKEHTLYVAVPLRNGTDTIAVVRASSSVEALDQAIKGITFKFALIAALMASAAGLLSYGISRRITRPLEEINAWAQALSQGATGQAAEKRSGNEIEILAQSLGAMAAQLKERMAAMIRQKNEVEALLSSISEGIVAVDGDERIIMMNKEAAAMFSCDWDVIVGRSLQEAVRNTDLYTLVRKVLDSGTPAQEELTFSSNGERYVNAKATVLKDESGLKKGVVIALNDITDLKRLERIRKDFVANVSHEIKTPLTTIKGFVETLQESGPEDEHQRKRFLSIMERQVGRLEALVDDLLVLSRLEQETVRNSLNLQKARLADIIASAIQLCGPKAEEKGISITFSCPEDLFIEMDPSLMEQAIFNLLDNAVKYSDNGKRVFVEATVQGRDVVIKVRDEGIGISREHLPRVFERFYRADKARSRESGGTGLGLSIVKHIVQAHGGKVSAESEPGKGSVFALHLPLESRKP